MMMMMMMVLATSLEKNTKLLTGVTCAETVQHFQQSLLLPPEYRMDQILSIHYVAAFCHILQPDRTVNFTEAKAQSWIQSPKKAQTLQMWQCCLG